MVTLFLISSGIKVVRGEFSEQHSAASVHALLTSFQLEMEEKLPVMVCYAWERKADAEALIAYVDSLNHMEVVGEIPLAMGIVQELVHRENFETTQPFVVLEALDKRMWLHWMWMGESSLKTEEIIGYGPEEERNKVVELLKKEIGHRLSIREHIKQEEAEILKHEAVRILPSLRKGGNNFTIQLVERQGETSTQIYRDYRVFQLGMLSRVGSRIKVNTKGKFCRAVMVGEMLEEVVKDFSLLKQADLPLERMVYKAEASLALDLATSFEARRQKSQNLEALHPDDVIEEPQVSVHPTEITNLCLHQPLHGAYSYLHQEGNKIHIRFCQGQHESSDLARLRFEYEHTFFQATDATIFPRPGQGPVFPSYEIEGDWVNLFDWLPRHKGLSAKSIQYLILGVLRLLAEYTSDKTQSALTRIGIQKGLYAHLTAKSILFKETEVNHLVPKMLLWTLDPDTQHESRSPQDDLQAFFAIRDWILKETGQTKDSLDSTCYKYLALLSNKDKITTSNLMQAIELCKLRGCKAEWRFGALESKLKTSA